MDSTSASHAAKRPVFDASRLSKEREMERARASGQTSGREQEAEPLGQDQRQLVRRNGHHVR